MLFLWPETPFPAHPSASEHLSIFHFSAGAPRLLGITPHPPPPQAERGQWGWGQSPAHPALCVLLHRVVRSGRWGLSTVLGMWLVTCKCFLSQGMKVALRPVLRKSTALPTRGKLEKGPQVLGCAGAEPGALVIFILSVLHLEARARAKALRWNSLPLSPLFWIIKLWRWAFPSGQRGAIGSDGRGRHPWLGAMACLISSQELAFFKHYYVPILQIGK